MSETNFASRLNVTRLITLPYFAFDDYTTLHYYDVMKWKYFPRHWPFVRGIHRSPVNSPHKGQWRGALTFYLICVWINDWVNNREAGDLRPYRVHYDVIVKILIFINIFLVSAPDLFSQNIIHQYIMTIILTGVVREQYSNIKAVHGGRRVP